MAEVGGMLASAALRVATQKLASAMGDRAMLQWSFDRDLEGMKTTLESVAAVLEDAERRSIRDAAARLWLKRLKAAAYDVSDLLDEFHARAERASRKVGAGGCSSLKTPMSVPSILGRKTSSVVKFNLGSKNSLY
jgi:hypothetical protein